MPKPFDATTKELLESDPRAWLELLLGRKVGEVRILNVDLSTITTSDELIDRLLEGVQSMKESVTYQKILREGRAEGLVEGERRILRRLGGKRFGKPNAQIEAKLDAIADLERLEQLSDRVLEVTTWDELLAQP